MSELQQTVALVVSRLVHDLKNPLAVVLANLRYLESAASGTDEREALDESLVSAWMLDRMLDDVVDLHRIRSGALALAAEPVALAPLADLVAERLSLVKGDRELQLEVAEVQLVTDGALLSRALANLLEHALRQTPGRGTVLLGGRAEADGFVLRVVDGGLPFAPGVQPSFLDDDLPSKRPPPAGFRSDQGLKLHFAGVAARALGAQTTVEARTDDTRGVAFELRFPAEKMA